MSEKRDTDRRLKADLRRVETMLPRVDGRPAPTPTSNVGNAEAFSLPLDLGEVVATEVLARGGMGITFLGHLTSNSQQVAIKIPLNADTNLQERFRNEARLLAGLNHEQIVRFVAAGETEISLANEKHKLPWLAMEFIPGQSLRAKLNQGGSMQWAEVSRLLEDVLKALDYLHAANFCHRDIKPDNLIHDPQTDSWKLVDFGIAKALVENLRLTLTLAETHPGAWDYMSPEQLSGQPLDIRSDIYSLGKTAWEALIGDVPRVGTPYPSAFLGPEKVPPDVDLLIRKMVEHRPGSRYQTPAEALTALRDGAGVIANKEERRKSARKFVRILNVTAATVALGAGVWFVGNEFETQKAKAIVSSVSAANPTRSTMLRRKLETFRNTHWFWGRHYADEQFAKLEQTAGDEQRRMAGSHQEISRELENAARDDDYKLERCRSFCSLYSEAYLDTPEFKDLSAKKEIFEARVVSTKVEQLAKDGKITEALQLCDELKPKLTVTEAVMKVSDTRGNIARSFAEKELVEIKRLAASKKEEDLLSAQSKATQLEKVVGAIPETRSVLKLVDDSFYTAAIDTANTRLDKREYSAARSTLDRYLELSELKAHRADTLNAKQKVAESEDDSDWSTVAASAEKNLNQRTFPLAALDYKNYLDKWSGGRHAQDAQQGLRDIVGKHFKFLDDIQDYDDFVEEFKKVVVQYPQEGERLRTAKQWLVFHCHKEIGRLYSDIAGNKTQPLTALNRVNQLDWQVCEQQQRQYLETTADKFRAYLNNPQLFSANEFLYYWQRPPQECVKMPSAPSVFFINLESLDVSLSDSTYRKIAGVGDADPRIRVNLCQDKENARNPLIRELFSGLGAVNQRSFKVAINKSVFFEKGSEILQFALDDADHTGDNNIKVGKLGKTAAESEPSVTWNFPDGTTFMLRYKIQ
jgi:hypothetical protein